MNTGAGKGDTPRPFAIPIKTYLDNFDMLDWNDMPIEQTDFDTPAVDPLTAIPAEETRADFLPTPETTPLPTEVFKETE